MSKPVKWKLKIEHLMACNCNWGCPCSFNAAPTYHTCEAALAYRVVEGKYGNVPLDGLAWVVAATWPGPLHEGNGRAVVFLDDRAMGAQREALEAIAAGKAGGPIGIFMSTVTNGLEVQTATLEFVFEGKQSHFHAGEAVKVAFEPIRNPVTGAEHRAALHLPTGLIAKREEHFSSRSFYVNAAGLNYSYPGRTAIAMQSTWRGP